MSLRVIGAGVGRTGTLSLKFALERLLGAPCYHMMEAFRRPGHFERWTEVARGEKVDWNALFDGFVATVDWPSAAFWRELSAAYPDAIILLSTRPSDAWWQSAMETIFGGQATPTPAMRTMLDAMLQARFTPNPRDREAAIAAYERHNAEVRATAPPARLLDWVPADGWGPLCRVLGVPVPSEPFPHANTTAEFKARPRPPSPT
jgi:Sulfotransferase domain